VFSVTRQITTVDVEARTIPLAESFPTSYGDLPTDHCFVRVTDGETVGYGEGAALRTFTGETAATMAVAARNHYAPAVVDEPPDAALRSLAAARDRLPDHPGAAVAVEAAVLDLKARRRGVPLRDLLGPTRRTTVPTVYAVGGVPPDEAVDRVASGLEDGYTRFKLKANGEPRPDAERINDVIDRLAAHGDPDELSVRIDANTGWETAERAARAVERIERPEYVEYLEQPVDADATADLRHLRRHGGLPVFADESIHDLGDVRSLLAEPAAVSGVCLKLAKTGSLREWTTMAEVAADAGRPVTPISAFDTSLGAALTLHLCATVPRLSAGAEIIPDMVAEELATDPLDVAPEIPVPDGPGVGVDLPDSLFD
jgi:L-alanine-DL-glutamate epimerase-like enolase superfamily enzyme